ncbi:MAG: peroxidase [Deltaproteobacteria bacterium]|nr:MAG: peroxidase [Deltaproteobacteria bacterium]
MRAIVADWRSAPLPEADRELCRFAEKLTRTPAGMTRSDVTALRRAGFDDRAIHDAAQVAAYFNYINRVADALGLEPEPFLERWEAQGNGFSPQAPTARKGSEET